MHFVRKKWTKQVGEIESDLRKTRVAQGVLEEQHPLDDNGPFVLQVRFIQHVYRKIGPSFKVNCMAFGAKSILRNPLTPEVR